MRKFTICLMAGAILLWGSAAIATTMSALTSMETQVAKAADTPYPIKVTGDDSSSFKIEGSKVTILHAGDFYLSAAAQVGGNTAGEIYLWMRVNGKDVDDSNSIQTIPSAGFTTVLVSQTGFTFKKGDVVEFVYAASKPGLGLVASRPKGMPGVPSIIFSIFEL
jgi:hypothetical protein